MVNLRPITSENYLEAFRLSLAPGQKRFVSDPVRSLAQAYVWRNQCQPFGIYAGENHGRISSRDLRRRGKHL